MSTTTFNESTLPSRVVEAETYDTVSPHVVILSDPRSAAAEQYRVLRYRLECLGRNGIKAIAFTSAGPGEGRTTTVVNTALALGRGGRYRVALVDADLRRPNVHRLLGLHPREGLCDVVAGRATLAGTLWRFGSDELFVLPAGQLPADPGTTLYDARLSAVMTELKSKFDFVLCDTPPILPLADVPTLCRDLDGALMVVRASVTSRELVSAGLDALRGVPVHGLVLSQADPAPSLGTSPAPVPQQRALPLPREG